jgi:hypothetical protein
MVIDCLSKLCTGVTLESLDPIDVCQLESLDPIGKANWILECEMVID